MGQSRVIEFNSPATGILGAVNVNSTDGLVPPRVSAKNP
jgi:hypothetical protein